MEHLHASELASLVPRLQSVIIMLKEEAVINQAIAEADPLEIDEVFLQLPALNEQSDIIGIRRALERAVAKAQNGVRADFILCSAAIRDLSVLGASLMRLEKEPADCVPGFSETLLALSASIASPIPRDSFIDYTSRNPGNERERTFTSLPQERVFIDSLQ